MDDKNILFVLEKDKNTEKSTTKQEEYIYCPECGVKLIHESGCVTCPSCGWGLCG